MDNLPRLLSSRVKAEVFRLLFGPDALELHVREIARRAGLNEATVRQELSALAGLRLVALRRDGNRAYYRAETANPLCADIRNIVRKTSGLVGVPQAAPAGKPTLRSPRRRRKKLAEVSPYVDRDLTETPRSPDWAVWDRR